MTQSKIHDDQFIETLAELISGLYDMDQIFDFIIYFIENNYEAELKDVHDTDLRMHIIEQRLPSAFEESGIFNTITELLSDLGISSRLDKLKTQQSALQAQVEKLNDKIDTLVSNLTQLQINSFGRVLQLFDNRVVDLAEDEEEVMLVEKPVGRTSEQLSNEVSNIAWRTLQPSELLIGLKLAISQPVLYRKTRHAWFPGRVVSCQQTQQQDQELQEPSSKSDELHKKSNNLVKYIITLDALADNKPETCEAKPESVALAVSAHELRQKYPVGARVVSIYRDDFGGIGYYSGLIAEPPSERNNHRYLLFFDDGYTQYSPPNEIYRICHQSKENWKEATETSQEFIRRYLAQYPQRPMVRLKVGQIIETELDGEWIEATVEKVDASLALMSFKNGHSEWIYRGSTRFEPLFSDLMSNNNSSSRLNNQRVEVQYSSVEASLISVPKRRKARKSATGNWDPKKIASNQGVTIKHLDPIKESSTKKVKRSSSTTTVSLSSSATTAMTLATTSNRSDRSDLEDMGVIVPYLDYLFKEVEFKIFQPHKCDPSCLITYRKNPDSVESNIRSENPLDYKGLNPLEIPFHAGWLRYLSTAHRDDVDRQIITYTAPCGRRLRSMHELERFLDSTNSQLTSDLFCFDPSLIINREFRAEKTLTNIADLSYGKENVPVHCVNSVDNEVPGYIDYISHRQPVGNVPLLQDQNFLVCCDCTDNCRDRTKCACQQLTVEASALTNPSGMVDSQAGYKHRRLAQFTVGGIYECNSGCPCDRRCSNRVVQQGLWVRLQVFKTSRKGWGIRALHAIPKGCFICTYAGAIYDENMAVQEGFDYGDEYQAELDYIETVEKEKEGYESFPEDLEEALREISRMEAENAKTEQANNKSSFQNNNNNNNNNNKISQKITPNNKPDQTRDFEVDPDGRQETLSVTSSASELTTMTNLTEVEDDRTSRCSEMSGNSSMRNLFVALEPLPKKVNPKSVGSQQLQKQQKSLKLESDEANLESGPDFTNPCETKRDIAVVSVSQSGCSSPELPRTGSDDCSFTKPENNCELSVNENDELKAQPSPSQEMVPVTIDCPSSFDLDSGQEITNAMGPTLAVNLSPLNVSVISPCIEDLVSTSLESSLTNKGDIKQDDSSKDEQIHIQGSTFDHKSQTPAIKLEQEGIEKKDKQPEYSPNLSDSSKTLNKQDSEPVNKLQPSCSATKQPVKCDSSSETSAYEKLREKRRLWKKRWKEKWRTRSLSLPKEFRLLKNSRELLKQADFAKTAVVRLSPLNIPETCSDPPSSPLPSDSQQSSLEKRILRTPKHNLDYARMHNISLPIPFKSYSKKKDSHSRSKSNTHKLNSDKLDGIKTTQSPTTFTNVQSSATSKCHGPLTLKLRRVRSTSNFTTLQTTQSSLTVIDEHKYASSECEESASESSSTKEFHKRNKYSTSNSNNNNNNNESDASDLKSSSTLAPSKLRRSQRIQELKLNPHLYHNHHHLHFGSASSARKFYPVAQKGWLQARDYFADVNPYIMDAKKMGNLGRYFNHSCNPNVFVQNVFIDSHDPRFPEVAFFTKRNIEVGEEMTWDYGYTVDAVPCKVLYCYCGEPNCRIRLL